MGKPPADQSRECRVVARTPTDDYGHVAALRLRATHYAAGNAANPRAVGRDKPLNQLISKFGRVVAKVGHRCVSSTDLMVMVMVL
jgi:hypothetical protein